MDSIEYNSILFVTRFPFSILFIDPPEITKRPINQSVRVGGVASFFCAGKLTLISFFLSEKTLELVFC